jgi:hypothetical protein
MCDGKEKPKDEEKDDTREILKSLLVKVIELTTRMERVEGEVFRTKLRGGGSSGQFMYGPPSV